MKLLYRADGGHPVGTGHVFRAVRVLRALAERTQLDATLAVGGDESALRIAADAPARVVRVDSAIDPTENKPLLRASSVLPILESECFDLIAIDMLDTADEEMRSVAKSDIPIVCFDDRGWGRLHATALINILITEPDPKSLKAKRLYEGGRYAALDPIFAQFCGAYSRSSQLRKVFVSMGGADAAGLTVKVARALGEVAGLEQVDFIAGPAFVHREALDQALASAPWQAQVLPPQPNLLLHYLDCDLAIIAGGLTMYEVCCVGVPSLAVCQPIDHQLELSVRLADAGAMTTIGDGVEAREAEIADAVARLAPVDVRKQMSAIGPQLVDGRGCERIADILIEVAGGPVQ